jgi:hypothetical protein
MKIVQVANTMISNKDKISNVIRVDNEFYFLYDKKYKWSEIKTNSDDYIVHFYPMDNIGVEDISEQRDWGNYQDFVTYSTIDLKTREARETFTELYQVLADKLYGIDDIFDNIIREDF